MQIKVTMLALLGGVLLSAPAFAQDKTTQAGKPVLIWSTWNCQKHIPPAISGTAKTGKVETKSAVENRCGSASEPVTQLWYTPPANFKGTEEVMVYGGAGGVGNKVRVTVK